jgi:hypothetical protein
MKRVPNPVAERERFTTLLQPHVDEPILAVGLLSGAGDTDGMISDFRWAKWHGLFFGQSFARRDREERIALRTPTLKNDLVAVTATQVFLFDYPTNGETFTAVTAPPVVWSRDGLLATVDAPRRLTQRLNVRLATGEQLEYDLSNVSGAWGRFSNSMRDLLMDPPRATVS